MTRRFGFVLGQVLLGLGWFVYHLPALLFTSYGKSDHVIAGNLLFLVSVVALSVCLGYVRQASESLWPCAVFHAAHNLLFLHLFDPMQRTSPHASWFVGEQGLMLALVLTALGIWGARAQKRLAPSLPPPTSQAAPLG